MPCEDRDRDWKETAVNQGTKDGRPPAEAGRDKEGLFPGAPEAAWPGPHLVWGSHDPWENARLLL